jgi:cell wall-associated NlpC family hydrolase
MNRRFSRALIAVVATAGLALTATVVAPSWAVPSYPTAAEVAAAKKNVTAKKAMIARLDAIIAELEADAEKLGRVAQIKGEAFNQAQGEVDKVAVKVNSLQAQADAATAAAGKAKTQLGQIAAQMYRGGAAGTSLDLFLNAGKADDLLYKLGANEKIAQQSDEIYQRSIAQQLYAQALTDQLQVAKDELATKATAAKVLFDEASNAAGAVQAKVDENNRVSKTMYAQLATLRNTASDLERQRAEGLAAERRQQAGSANMSAPELYAVGDPDAGKVQIAFDFMKAQLGERYVLGGMGPDVWDCSGLMKAGYSAAGIYIGTHSATNQFRTMGAARKLVPLSEMKVGDLLWYSQESAFDGDKYHVVMFVGGGLMIEAPNPARTVRIVPIRWGEMFPYAGRPSA